MADSVFQDFMKYWDQLEICHLSSDTFDIDSPHGWSTQTFHGNACINDDSSTNVGLIGSLWANIKVIKIAELFN